MTNCLQFNKEIELNPSNSGTSRSRAMVSELLAIKLLREYSTRELIDALSFEFYPLQGQPYPGSERTAVGVARVSCLEVAIRTQAKRFLSHPVIVQQLEGIWAGTIVFHSAADNLHRSPQAIGAHGYSHNGPNPNIASPRRSVTLYDPRDASLFKLSRLRVPRYRQFLSTLSFAVLLGLFLAVLQRRRMEITTLEIIFWLWSAGFMLDEIVGFNEQGFSLYIMSFWNVFDLGILLLLVSYYCMRLYSVWPYAHNQVVAAQAYDLLAANAVLLFPRLFSILDHYRYFSQLLIAFRIMASDLVAVFFLIIIACSGFFIAFTLSFGNSHSPGSIAYFCFQIVMGFTPAAWSLWEEYNVLGKIILTLFLFICHFVVVTILITVLTNSFMDIVKNGFQEHQFVFAVNVFSMVKSNSDALFSYVAPTNIVAWLVIPLQYVMPFRQFIKVNRTIIKITHLPILFTICFYEKMILCSKVEKPTDLIDPRPETPRARPSRTTFQAFSSNGPRLVREPSVATYQKDRALDEVFRRPFGDTNRPARDIRRPFNNSVVKNWMQEMGSPANPPDEQDSDEVNRLERLPRRFRLSHRRPFRNGLRDFTETHSVPSNPDELVGRIASPSPRRARNQASPRRIRALSRHTDAEGDDELTSDDNGNSGKVSIAGQSDVTASKKVSDKSPPAFYSSRPSTARLISRKSSPTSRPKLHTRNVSNATMLYNPISPRNKPETESSSTPIKPDESPEKTAALSTSADHWSTGQHSLGANPVHNATISRSDPMSVPELGGFVISNPRTRGRRQPIPFELGSDLGDNKAIASGFLGPAPSSFTTQMAYATGAIRGPDSAGEQDMLSKLVLARMNNIEEGFREVIKEVKDLRRSGSSRSQSRPDESRSQPRKRRVEKKDTKRPTSWLSKEKTESHTETNGKGNTEA